ncbi:MAG: hypothetical protein ACLRW2_03065 [Parasutterella excrementihominis]
MPTSFIAQDIMAEHLLSHNAIVFLKDKPMRLRSGLVTPIYVDNRILPSYPEAWRDIVETMASASLNLSWTLTSSPALKAPELLTAPPGLPPRRSVRHGSTRYQELRQPQSNRRYRRQRQKSSHH